MSAVVAVTLDTTAPMLSWATGTIARPGVLKIVPYAVDEPTLLSASFVDANNVQTFATILSNAITFTPPADALRPAELHVVTRDSVLNQATRTLPISLGVFVSRAVKISSSIRRWFTSFSPEVYNPRVGSDSQGTVSSPEEKSARGSSDSQGVTSSPESDNTRVGSDKQGTDSNPSASPDPRGDPNSP